jgi:hypothetical protein
MIAVDVVYFCLLMIAVIVVNAVVDDAACRFQTVFRGRTVGNESTPNSSILIPTFT